MPLTLVRGPAFFPFPPALEPLEGLRLPAGSSSLFDGRSSTARVLPFPFFGMASMDVGGVEEEPDLGVPIGWRRGLRGEEGRWDSLPESGSGTGLEGIRLSTREEIGSGD